MPRHRRLLVLMLTLVATLAILALAGGLPTPQAGPFPAAPPSPAARPQETPASATPAPGELHPETIQERGLWPVIVIVLVLLILVIFMLVTAEGRRLLLYTVLMLLLLAAVLLLRGRPADQGKGRATMSAAAEETPAAGPAQPAFEPPPWLVLSASVAAGLLIVGAGVLAGRRLRRRGRPTRPDLLPALAEEARQALTDIQFGQDLRDTVLRCYREMERTLQERRDIRRGPAMTPQEFARGLATTDLPQADIWRITRLFERARYGQHRADQVEEAEAVACLQAIVRACEGSP